MKLIIPFRRDNFAEEMKPKLSGSNVTLEFENIESTLVKVGVEISDLIGAALYEKLCEKSASANAELNDEAHDHLQRAMLHFALFQHAIFLIARIGNDGITVKKNEDETTIFKYQADELKNELIKTGWFWMNRLIRMLNEHASDFGDWENSAAQQELKALPVSSADFDKWVGVNSDFFMLHARWIIREVWTDCVLSRHKQASKTDKIARALCYEVMARACMRLAYYALPEPIRLDINNEMGKNHNAQADTFIREKVSAQFQAKADAYWHAVEQELASERFASEKVSKQAHKPYQAQQIDSFAY